MNSRRWSGPLCWLALVTLFLITAVRGWPDTPWLETGFESLLPEIVTEDWAQLALDQRSSVYQGQLLLFVEGAGAERFLDQAFAKLASAGYAPPDPLEREISDWQAMDAVLQEHQGKLLAPATAEQLRDDPQAYLHVFQQRLHSPLAGIWLRGLDRDPLGLHQDFLQSALPQREAGMGEEQVLARVIVPPEALAFARIGGLYSLYEQLAAQARLEGLTLRATGAPLFAAYGVLSAQTEMRTVGLVSLLALLAALMVRLRSIRALLLLAICVAMGMAGGAVSTLLVFQHIHVLTLVFGLTLLGIAADYAFHYLCHTLLPQYSATQALKKVLPGLSLGVVSSVVGFGALLLLPFPGLRQVGLFMASGLLCSFLTVCLIFPAFLQSSSRAQGPASPRPLAPRWRWLVWLLALLLVPGVLRLQARDDVRDFYVSPPALAQDQSAMAGVMGAGQGAAMILLRAGSEGELLRQEEALIDSVSGLRPGLTAVLPSPDRQRANLELLRHLFARGPVLDQLLATGLSPAIISDYQSRLAVPFEPLLPDALPPAASGLLSGGFLGCREGECAAWLLPLGTTDPAELAMAVNNLTGVNLLDPVASINEEMAYYREAVARLLLVAAVLIGLLLAFLIGWRRAITVMVVPLFSCVLSLACIGWLQGNYGVINLLALMLVAAVGMDYGLFRSLTDTADQGATSVAIGLSVATSACAFGALALSETPLIHQFGLTIALGLLFAWLVARLLPLGSKASS